MIMLKYPDFHRVSVDNQGGAKDTEVTIKASVSDMLVKKVGRTGIVYLPTHWADSEVIVVRQGRKDDVKK